MNAAYRCPNVLHNAIVGFETLRAYSVEVFTRCEDPCIPLRVAFNGPAGVQDQCTATDLHTNSSVQSNLVQENLISLISLSVRSSFAIRADLFLRRESVLQV